MYLTIQGHAQNEKCHAFKVKPEDVLASCHANDYLRAFQNVAVNFSAERKKLSAELLNIFKDPKTSNLDQCAAAYYLGEMRVPEAVDALRVKITLRLDVLHLDIDGLPVFPLDATMDALIKIGNPSIPAAISESRRE